MERINLFCFLASYTVAFALELTRFLGRSSLSRFVMLGFTSAGLLAQTLYLLNRATVTNLPPLLSSTHDWMLVLAWVVVTLFLLLSIADRGLAIGPFLLPIVLLFVASTYAMDVAPPEPLNSQRGWKLLHAASLVFGMLSVVFGFLSAAMYLLQHRWMRQRGPAVRHEGFRMPSLERLAQINRWTVATAFFLLSLGFGTGLYLTFTSPSGTSVLRFTDPLVIFSGIAWLCLAALLIWLTQGGTPSGRQVAWLTMFALGVLLVTVVGLQMLTGGHPRQVDSERNTAAACRPVRIAGLPTDERSPLL